MPFPDFLKPFRSRHKPITTPVRMYQPVTPPARPQRPSLPGVNKRRYAQGDVLSGYRKALDKGELGGRGWGY